MSLSRALGPESQPHWLWQDDAGWCDLSAAGLADDLAEVAAWLLEIHDGNGQDQPSTGQAAAAGHPLLTAAPRVDDAGSWPHLQPGHPGKALALGRNFAAHAREMGAKPGGEMCWFTKLPGCLSGPDVPVVIPSWLQGRIDPEAELVLLIGATLQECSAEQAAAAIAAYTLGNDVTARGVQAGDKEKSWPWTRSKNLAGFGPFGPAWIPAAHMPPWDQLELVGRVNGEVQQHASLADMIWPPVEALVELSRWLPLHPGDLVFLGTPSGVAGVQANDQLEVALEGPGALDLKLSPLRNVLLAQSQG